MKKKFTFLTAVVMLLAFLAVPLGMRGQKTVTFTAETDTNTSGSVTKSGITVSMSTMHESVYKCYKSTSMSVSSTVGNITGVVVNCTENGEDKYGPGCFIVQEGNPGSYSFETSGPTGTWTGNSSTLELYASTNQVRMNSIVITYTPLTPEILIPAEELALAYTANDAGSFAVTYTNSYEPVLTVATLYSDAECNTPFPTSGDDAWIEIDDMVDPWDEIIYIVDANTGTATRTAYIKVEAVDDENNEIEKVFTITQAGCYTVSYYTNGIADGTAQVAQGQAIGTLPTATAAYIPTGYTFIGWYNGDIEPTSTAPTCFSSSDVVTNNLTLKAVFAMASGSGSSNTYALVSDVDDLNNGDIIILVSTGSYTSSGQTHNFTVANGTVNTSTKLMAPVDVTISENKVTSTSVAPITLVAVTGGWKLQMGTQYLNIVAAQNQITLDDNGATNTITISSNAATIGGITDGSDTRRISYNPNNGNGRFAYYKSTQKAVSIYKQETSVTYSNYRTSYTANHNLVITGYGDNNNVKTGWNLIASPVFTTPDAVNNMLSNTYDLYRFNQSASNDLVWENYKNDAHQSGFTITPGQGYLYANSNTVTLTFTGSPYNSNVVALAYDGDVTDAKIKGLNLVGNPLTTEATVTKDYYAMNPAGSDVIASSDNVGVMQGIFVYADDENDTEMTFTAVSRDTKSNTNSGIILNLSGNDGNVIDRAIVRFGEGQALPKFQLFESSTRIYILQDGNNYAVVRSNAKDEKPIYFVPARNGQYTINVALENVEVDYLHLIDNIAGTDIDLLATPSYTFNAKGDDYESRFRLVFSTTMVNAEMGEDFAFISDGQLVIANVGEAILQVIDVTGRVVANENINGTCSKAISAKAGVYVLRLINGTDVKTQKIVIR